MTPELLTLVAGVVTALVGVAGVVYTAWSKHGEASMASRDKYYGSMGERLTVLEETITAHTETISQQALLIARLEGRLVVVEGDLVAERRTSDRLRRQRNQYREMVIAQQAGAPLTPFLDPISEELSEADEANSMVDTGDKT